MPRREGASQTHMARMASHDAFQPTAFPTSADQLDLASCGSSAGTLCSDTPQNGQARNLYGVAKLKSYGEFA